MIDFDYFLIFHTDLKKYSTKPYFYLKNIDNNLYDKEIDKDISFSRINYFIKEKEKILKFLKESKKVKGIIDSNKKVILKPKIYSCKKRGTYSENYISFKSNKSCNKETGEKFINYFFQFSKDKLGDYYHLVLALYLLMEI